MQSFSSAITVLSLILITITLLPPNTNAFLPQPPNPSFSLHSPQSSTHTAPDDNRTPTTHIVRAAHGDGEEAGGRHAAAAAKSLDDAKVSSFEDAQVLGRDLARILTESCGNGEPMPEEAVSLLRALISTTSGARGWFVTLLTDPAYEPVFTTPIDESFLTALCDTPDPNIKLMTMNVAMSTATEITHRSMGNDDLAEGSVRTSRRATVLARELLGRLPGLREEVEALRSAVDGREEGMSVEWVKFCKKWGYGDEQKEAINKKIEVMLG